MSSTTQRTQLSDFLKSCRARTPPDAVGLTRAHRSRSRGLRREDVAALAGLSATWYTWLEQGRDVHPSDQVLERLSTALGLSAVERDYLFMLAQGRPPAIAPSTESEVRPAVRRMLEALNVPAIVHSRTWDVVAWNRVWPRCFPDFAARAPDDRNLLKILLTEQDFQHDMAEYERMARRVLAKARLDYSQAANDPAFNHLIEDLNDTCPIFRRLWRSPDVVSCSEGQFNASYPQVGAITYEHTSYSVEAAPHQKLLIFSPLDEKSADNLAKLLRN